MSNLFQIMRYAYDVTDGAILNPLAYTFLLNLFLLIFVIYWFFKRKTAPNKSKTQGNE